MTSGKASFGIVVEQRPQQSEGMKGLQMSGEGVPLS